MGADRVIVMNQGSIHKSGLPLEIFREIDDLKKLGLDVPLVVELAHELRKKGVEIPAILSINELVDSLCS